MMEEVDEVDELESDLCDLEVIEYHVVTQHLVNGPVVVVKYEQISVVFHLLL